MKEIANRIILGVGILAALVVGGCAETAEDEKQFNEEEYASGSYPAEGEGLEIAIDSVRYVEEAADGYSFPNQREEILEIELTAKNDSSVKIDIDTFNFYIRNVEPSGGSFYYSSDDMNFDGSIGPGKEFTGKFYFDVPEKESYELVYMPLSPKSDDNTFLVTPEKNTN
ncbi:DUF4352 domain-containing protein [Sporosarcina luteola]|uniref:DUF4352 domain-containing protein n=1 Tax=Sporosarcina luteola TaxID=582850 RepID=UPI002040F9FC|nr:DUF4352 domain-containing protein [Sporosarcina luteola]MCM3711501.1 DUF4352 domain-containing protein [Sporosarcina luteola]